MPLVSSTPLTAVVLSSSEWLAILGGLLEIVGFVLVAFELFRMQHRELGDPRVVEIAKSGSRRVQIVLRKLFRRTRTHTVGIELGTAYSIEEALKLKVRKVPGDTVELRLSALESNLADLDREVEEHRAELDQAIQSTAKEARERHTTLEQQQKEREAAQKEFLRGSVMLQWWGIRLFVLGAICSTAANITQ